jgi:hypothetical protein
MTMQPKVAAIVVLYHPNPEGVQTALKSWMSQVDLLVCIDNGGCGSLREAIESILSSNSAQVRKQHGEHRKHPAERKRARKKNSRGVDRKTCRHVSIPSLHVPGIAEKKQTKQ